LNRKCRQCHALEKDWTNARAAVKSIDYYSTIPSLRTVLDYVCRSAS